MKRYKYKVIDTGKHLEQQLNELGQQGWQVVGVTTKKQLLIAPPQAIILMREVQTAVDVVPMPMQDADDTRTTHPAVTVAKREAVSDWRERVFRKSVEAAVAFWWEARRRSSDTDQVGATCGQRLESRLIFAEAWPSLRPLLTGSV